jgi:hypothetical protein
MEIAASTFSLPWLTAALLLAGTRRTENDEAPLLLSAAARLCGALSIPHPPDDGRRFQGHFTDPSASRPISLHYLLPFFAMDGPSSCAGGRGPLPLCQGEAVLDVIHATNESALAISRKGYTQRSNLPFRRRLTFATGSDRSIH